MNKWAYEMAVLLKNKNSTDQQNPTGYSDKYRSGHTPVI